METWEIHGATDDEIAIVRAWAQKRPVTLERIDVDTVNVHLDARELEDELVTICDAYGITVSLI